MRAQIFRYTLRLLCAMKYSSGKCVTGERTSSTSRRQIHCGIPIASCLMETLPPIFTSNQLNLNFTLIYSFTDSLEELVLISKLKKLINLFTRTLVTRLRNYLIAHNINLKYACLKIKRSIVTVRNIKTWRLIFSLSHSIEFSS